MTLVTTSSDGVLPAKSSSMAPSGSSRSPCPERGDCAAAADALPPTLLTGGVPPPPADGPALAALARGGSRPLPVPSSRVASVARADEIRLRPSALTR